MLHARARGRREKEGSGREFKAQHAQGGKGVRAAAAQKSMKKRKCKCAESFTGRELQTGGPKFHPREESPFATCQRATGPVQSVAKDILCIITPFQNTLPLQNVQRLSCCEAGVPSSRGAGAQASLSYSLSLNRKGSEMAAPHNIKRYIAREEDLAARHEDLKKASITGTQASWFEAQALSKGNPREIERQTKA